MTSILNYSLFIDIHITPRSFSYSHAILKHNILPISHSLLHSPPHFHHTVTEQRSAPISHSLLHLVYTILVRMISLILLNFILFSIKDSLIHRSDGRIIVQKQLRPFHLCNIY